MKNNDEEIGEWPGFIHQQEDDNQQIVETTKPREQIGDPFLRK